MGDHKILLKVGNSMQLPTELEDFSWYGRGPWESYADRKFSAMVGVYKGLVKINIIHISARRSPGIKQMCVGPQFHKERKRE